VAGVGVALGVVDAAPSGRVGRVLWMALVLVVVLVVRFHHLIVRLCGGSIGGAFTPAPPCFASAYGL